MDSLEDIKLERPKEIVVNGETFLLSDKAEKSLRKNYIAKAEENILAFQKTTKAYLAGLKSNYETRIEELEKTSRSSFPLPPFQSVLSKEIVLGTYDNGIRCVLPFKYAPKTANGMEIDKPKNLERDVFLQLDIEGDSPKHISNSKLLNKDGSKFDHYHRYRDDDNKAFDCLGKFEYKNMEVRSLQDIYRYRDGLQELYSNINVERVSDGILTREHPSGLPSLDSIRITNKRVSWGKKPENKGSNVWRTTNTVSVTSRRHRSSRHSSFDFSILIPAVIALIFAVVILGDAIINSSDEVVSSANSTSNTTELYQETESEGNIEYELLPE